MNRIVAIIILHVFYSFWGRNKVQLCVQCRSLPRQAYDLTTKVWRPFSHWSASSWAWLHLSSSSADSLRAWTATETTSLTSTRCLTVGMDAVPAWRILRPLDATTTAACMLLTPARSHSAETTTTTTMIKPLDAHDSSRKIVGWWRSRTVWPPASTNAARFFVGWNDFDWEQEKSASGTWWWRGWTEQPWSDSWAVDVDDLPTPAVATREHQEKRRRRLELCDRATQMRRSKPTGCLMNIARGGRRTGTDATTLAGDVLRRQRTRKTGRHIITEALTSAARRQRTTTAPTRSIAGRRVQSS